MCVSPKIVQKKKGCNSISKHREILSRYKSVYALKAHSVIVLDVRKVQRTTQSVCFASGLLLVHFLPE